MDQNGFDEAFDDLLVVAFRVARRILGDDHAAEDVAAEALARAYAHWRRIGHQPWREGWVVRTASNLAIDLGRARSRHQDRSGPAVDPLPDTGTDDHETTVIRLALIEALAALPRRQREVVALRYLAGLSEAETAAALRVSTGSTKTHLSRGLNALRRRLGDDPTPALEVVTSDV